MRKAIVVEVQEDKKERRQQTRNSFTISFEGEEPKTVMMVTNKLASLFIEENLKVRELQAGGTSEFITKELLMMEDRLKRKEQEIRVLRKEIWANFLSKMDANLRILEQIQQQLRTMSEKIRAAEDRSIIFQGQLEQLKKLEPRGEALPNQGASESPRSREDPVAQLNALKRELASMQSRLKETHPDMIDLKKRSRR